MTAHSGKMSIAQFLTAERKRMVSYVRRLIDDTAARDGEDIVQDVALSLFNRADVLMPIETLPAYVYQSLRHRVVDHLRRRKDVVSLDEWEEDRGSPQPYRLSDVMADVEREVARSELREKIFQAIDGLSDEQKAVVIETELNGRSFRELSEQWEIPTGTLLARKSRAMVKIRDALKDFRE